MGLKGAGAPILPKVTKSEYSPSATFRKIIKQTVQHLSKINSEEYQHRRKNVMRIYDNSLI